MDTMKTLHEAFVHTLADVYYAEQQLLRALPKMAKAARHPDLKAAFDGHLEETRGQIETLKQVFAAIGEKAKGEKCDAIEGLIKEGEGIIKEAEGEALDIALAAVAQAVEHYEMARYTSLVAWAKAMGHAEAAQMLSGILKQEKAADAKLAEVSAPMLTGSADAGMGDAGKGTRARDMKAGDGKSGRAAK